MSNNILEIKMIEVLSLEQLLLSMKKYPEWTLVNIQLLPNSNIYLAYIVKYE